ncbi:T9SS type B sorting domain-containing protein [Flavobacterium aquidurense]|uniref:T9SS type B sorting domain-containing protein n=1 Tax=Flavobacterium aquidurense TaxID=362413 RepID=UPI00285DFDB3|nr:T9SS type B sorting domain-containing protein [Flavobacterium aquidurense]MDR7369844.1 gliding motility-associated-like protein [Flavobacterium aquidurense]
MRKPTILRTLIFVLAMLFNFASYAQDLIAFNSKLNNNLSENLFLNASNQFNGDVSANITETVMTGELAAPIIPNPIIKYAQAPYAGVVSTCPNDGGLLPKLFICGSNETRVLDSGITNASNIYWEKLTGGCTSVPNVNCANTLASCTWGNVGTGKTYNANIAGEYRLRVRYPDATESIFYFNVYTNDLDPTGISKSNILTSNACTVPGKITIGGFNNTFEYGYSKSTLTAPASWQNSNEFPITAAGKYNVYIRLKNVPGTCVFQVKNIEIESIAFNGSIVVTHPKCFGEKGNIRVNTGDLGLQYKFDLYKGNNFQTTSGNISIPEYNFTNVDPASDYKVISTIVGSCLSNTDSNIIVNTPNAQLTAVPSITSPTSCTSGNIKVTTGGGTGSGTYQYYYSIGGGAEVYNGYNDVIVVTTAGNYSIRVVDANNCTVTATTNIDTLAKPNYTITPVNPNCNSTTGSIVINVSNSNGYTLNYTKNNYTNTETGQTGYTYGSLTPGSYTIKVRYRVGNKASWCEDVHTIVIDEPASPVTASGGVAKLSGCGDVSKGLEIQGLLRVTNPQGGTPPYEYKFGTSGTWGPVREKYMNPGTYTLYIRDANLCEYAMPGIVLEAKPDAPRISSINTAYNCDGSASATVTVTNPTSSNYTYEYYLDGVLNTNVPSNIFVNVPYGTDGKHNVQVKYNLVDAKTYSNLLTEGFGKGTPTTSPGINPAYCFETQSGTHAPGYACNTDNYINDGEYAVTNKIEYRFGSWLDIRDHTSSVAPATQDPQGRFLAINIGGSAGEGGIIYRKPIYDVIPNQDVKVSFWVQNLINKDPAYADNDDPNITIELIANYGLPTQQRVAYQATGIIPKTNKWENYNMSLNPGNYTTLDFVVRSYSIEFHGNDLTVDDIKVFQIPESCLSIAEYPFVMDANKAFTGSVTGISNLLCYGDNSGKFQIVAENFNTTNGFDYTIDGGANWFNSKVSPVNVPADVPIPGLKLTGKTYDVRVRYDQANSACAKTIPTVITSPTAFVVDASASVANCEDGATVTATAVGGTAPYRLTLTNVADGTVTNFPTTAPYVLYNVKKGTYKVSGTDLHCSDNKDTDLVIDYPIPPTVTIDKTTGLCYDGNKATIKVDISGGAPPYKYEVDFNGQGYGQASAAFTATTFNYNATKPGTYTFRITDSNTCSNQAISQKIDVKISATTAITNTLSCSPTAPEATIKVDIYDGTAPYTYRVKYNTGNYGGVQTVTGSTFNYPADKAGLYTFEVKDVNGCPIETSATVNAITNPTVTATPTNPKCSGESTGQIILQGNGGSGGYEYNFNNQGWQTKSTYTGLAAAQYSYRVRDNKGCMSAAVEYVTLTNPAVLGGSIDATFIKCDATGTVPAVVTVTATGGTVGTGYTYSFNGNIAANFTASNSVSTTTGGSFTAYVKDGNGCVAGPFTTSVTSLDQISGITITDSGYDCSTTPPGGHVNIAAIKIDISAPIRFQIISGPAGYNSAQNSDGEFKSLKPGDYIFQAIDTKTGCFFNKPYTVNGAPDIVAGGSVVTPIKCFGDKGKIEFTVNGVKDRGYDYEITDASGNLIQDAKNVPETTTTISVVASLPFGTYTIKATDRKTKCEAFYSVTLSQPALPLSVTATAPKVYCGKYTVIIDADALGGTLNYSYAIGQGSVVPTTFGPSDKLTVDTVNGTQLNWVVYVKDANDCTAKYPISIIEEKGPVISSIDFNNQCTATSSSKFLITVNATGLAPLTYSIDGNNFQTDNFFNVIPGSYTVTVKDKNGCPAVATTPITVYRKLTAILDVKELDCSPTTPDATVTIDADGGKPGYTYAYSTNGGTSYSTMPSNVYTTSTPGTFFFKVTDANGCTFETSTTINSKSNPSLTFNKSQITCNGGTGSVQLFAAGGVPGYTFSDDGVLYTGISSYDNLAAGDHTFYVKDSKQCVGSVLINFANPAPVNATVTETPFSCSLTNTKVQGKVTINPPTGGIIPNTYTYSFNGSSVYTSNNVLLFDDNGSDQPYTYSVKDANGCLFSGSGTLHALNPPKIVSIVSSPILCLPTASQNSTITVTASNGVGTLAYEILSGPVINTTGAADGKFTGLTPGSYSFKVTDDNDCFVIGSGTVLNKSQIAVTATKVNDIDCNANSNGAIKYEVSGFTTTYSYTVNGAAGGTAQNATSFTLSNLPGTTTYNVVFTDDFTKCVVPTSITITKPASLTLNIVSNVNANCGKATSTVTVVAGGGTGTYQYAILDKDFEFTGTPVYGGSATFNINSNNGANPDWVIFVKDANGCTAKLNVTVATDPLPSVNATVNNQCGVTGNNFKIVASGSGGVAPYTYTINTGVAPSPADTFTVGPGTYIITVKDANNCPATVSVTVNEPMSAGAVKKKDITCAAPAEALIEVSVLGGKAPYSYRVKIGAGTYSGVPIPFPVAGNKFTYTTPSTPLPLTGTTYEFEISDSNGTVCTTVTNVITTTTPATVTATATKVEPTCNGFDDGSVEVNGTAGVSPFTYALVPNGTAIADTDFDTNNQFGMLTAGKYDYQVKDAKGCVSALQSITLIDPVKIDVDIFSNPIVCDVNTLGSFDIKVLQGGTAPYTYTLYDDAFVQINPATYTYVETGVAPTAVKRFSGLNFGYYYIIVKDSKGCEFRSPRLTIKTPPYLAMTATVDSNNCTAGVSVTVTTSGGVPNYTYSLLGQAPVDPATSSNTYTFLKLQHNTTYYLQVKDVNNCVSILEFLTPPAPSAIAITGTTVKDALCNGDDSGTLTFTVTGYDAGATGLKYQVLNALTLAGVTAEVTIPISTAFPITISNLKAGNYVLRVTEVGGTECSNSYTFGISQPILKLDSSVFSNKNANCNDPAQVTLRTTGGTPQYTYSYGFVPPLPALPVMSVFKPGNVLALDPGLAGDHLDWKIIVKDANGCTFPLDVTIAVDKSPVITAKVLDKCVAQDAYVIQVDGTLGTGANLISVDNKTSFVSLPGLPYNVTGLHSGDHTIYVQDANGCIAEQTITIDPPLGLTPIGTTLPTCADDDGVVTVTPIGGSGTFTYSISPSPATVSIVGNVISGLSAGSYTVTITDTNTSCTVDAPVTLLAPTPVTFNADAIAASCFGASDGSITVNLLPGNDNPVYTYSITPSPLGMVQVDNIFSNLPQGTYDITVTSGRNCPVTKPFTVTEPKKLKASATVKDFACDVNNAGQVAVVTIVPDATTGTGPYKYRFGTTSTTYNDVSTLDVHDDLPAGVKHTITYSIQDAHGCTTPDQTIDVNPFLKIDGLSFVAAPITCNDQKTDVQVNVSGGSTITNYAIIAPASAITNTSGATTGLFTDLDPGTYTFEVTNATGCKYQDFLEIKPVNNITVSGRTVKNVSCNETPALKNGSVEFTVANFSTVYSYTITPAPVPADVSIVHNTGYDVITINNLGVISYQIDVNDTATGCVASATAATTQPAIPLTLDLISNINANCNYGAQVTVKGKDGSGSGYTYAFLDRNVSPAPATPLATAYKASGYKVLDADPAKKWSAFVKDSNGCIAELPLTLNTDPLPTINPITGVCYTGDPVDVTLTGTGVGPLQFNIGNGYTTNPNFRLNAPGTYTFYVKDANDCVVTTPYVYELEQELLLKVDVKDLTCSAPASVVLTALQGTSSYTGGYEVSTDGVNFGPVTFVTGTTFETTTAGTYTFRVTDSQNCSAVSVPVVITPNVTPTFTYDKTAISCNNGSNGSFTIIPGLGTAPFEYSVNGGGYQSTDVPYSGLTSGVTYTVTVRDAKLCPSATQDITFINPPALAVLPDLTPFKCNTSNVPTDAILTLTTSGGTPSTTGEYSYSFDNGTTFGASPSKTFNTDKVVDYVVIDANGCRVSGSITIPKYTRPTDIDVTTTPIYCKTAGGLSTATVNGVTGGVGPYKYEIIYPVASAVVSTNGVFSNLIAGTYKIQVTDYNGTGCSTVKTIVIEEEDKITVTTQSVIDVACNGDATGTVSFHIANYINPAPAGFTAGFTYSLTPAGGTATQNGDVVTYTGLKKGSYTFTVKDNVSDCTASATNVVINEPANPLTFTTTKTNINCNDKEATITVNASGGTLNYEYAAVPSGTGTPTTFGGSKDLVVDTVNGTVLSWDVYVKDQKGCSPAYQTVLITTDPLPSGAVVAPYSQCPDPLNNNKYTFRIINVTGVGPFQYSIGSGFQDSDTFVVSNTGSYTLTVKDANQCEVQFPALVNILPVLDLQVKVTTLPNCTTNNGVIKATATGGATPANFEFSLDGNFPNTTGDFTLVAAGDHSITVTDLTTGCEDKVDFNIPDARPITGFTLVSSDVNCKGASDGTIIATINPTSPGVNDNPDYMYSITAGPVLRGFQLSNVFTGLPPGDYTVTVRSSRGCLDLEDISIKELAPIVVNAPLITQFSCTAGTNGTNSAIITVNSVTGGSSNYVLYSFFRNGILVQEGDSNVYTETNVLGGNYTVTVYDSKGCSASSTGTIVIDPFISLDDIAVNIDKEIICGSNEDITVSAVTTGGTPAQLLYSLEGTGTTVYSVIDQPTGDFKNLPIGNYLITVKNPVTKCSIQRVHYVFDPNTFEIVAAPVKTEICYGTSDGAVDLTFVDKQLLPANEAGIFDYVISGPVPSSGRTTDAGPFRIANLIAGKYDVKATLVGKPGCTVETSFDIEQPLTELTVSTSKSDITCNAGSNDGAITALAAGGWDDIYQYQLLLNGAILKDYDTEFNFTGLSRGTYTVNVKDGRGCIATATVVLDLPTPILVNAVPSATLLSCNGDKSATITVDPPTGGQGSGYLYTLNYVSVTPTVSSGPQDSPIFTGLGAGTYTVTVTDGFNCASTSATIIITEPGIIQPSLVQETDVTCFNDATLRLSATGGSSPYTYSEDGINFSTTPFNSSVVFPVSVGVHRYYVKDANGCTSLISSDVNINPVTPLTIELDLRNTKVNCTGDYSAMIVANAIGGLGNYEYSLLNNLGVEIRPAQPDGTFKDLNAGVYKVHVKSGDCEKDADFTVIESPNPLITSYEAFPVKCYGEKNGSIVVTASGGTGAIKYAISPNLDQFVDNGTFTGLEAGTYTVLVQDILGCIGTSPFTVVIEQPSILRANLLGPIMQEICDGDRDGSFSIEILGGTPPYSISLDDEKGTYIPVNGSQYTFSKLRGGTHTVFIKDATCTAEREVNMDKSILLNPTAEVMYDCIDNKQANMVTIMVDDSNTNPADIDYSLDNHTDWQPSNIFTNVAPGTHYVAVRHTNTCEAQTANFTIDAVGEVELVDITGNKTEINYIEVKAVGGIAPYEYSFNDEPFTSSSKYRIYKTDNYKVKVRDKNGCEDEIMVPGTFIDTCMPNYFTPDGDGQQDEIGPDCGALAYKDLTFDIFDRYGRVVAKYHVNEKWNGKYNGEDLPTGDYWYVLKLNDEKDAREFVGHFTLYR